jgi:hypothetical protein
MVEKTDDLVISISTDVATVKRSLKRLEADISSTTGKVEKQFNALGNGIDKSMSTALQKRIDGMVGIGTRGAKEWSGALADQGKELERLRARYSPLFATINNYKSAVADIKRAHAVGAISANEMAAAIQRERQAALASTAAIKGRNAALAASPAGGRGSMGAGAFNTSNLAAQGFDIATTAAFMPWQTVALQQGPQVAQVFNDIRASGQKIGPAVAGAFLQLVNPISLVTIGVIAAGAALIQYISSSKDVKSADDVLKGHAETISLLKERYGEAAKSLREYATESAQVAKADTEDRLRRARELVAEQAKITASFGPGILTENASILKDMNPDVVRNLRAAFADLNTSIKRGEPDILRFREALSRIANDESVPEPIRKLAQDFRQFDEDTLKLAKSIPEMVKSLDLIEGSADRQTQAINKLSNALRDLNKIGVAPLTDLQEAERLWRDARRDAASREERDDADTAYRDAVRRIGNANPTVVNPDGRTVSVPIPGQKPIQLGDEPDKKAETAAQRAANAYRDLIKSADDRIAQLQLETDLTGQYGVQTDAARFRLELLQQAEDKGRSLSAEQRAEIEKKVELYSKYSKALSEAKLQQDLLDDSAFAGLSKQEQAVKLRLRSYGLDEDLGGNNAAMIRNRFQQEELSDLTKSFLSEFSSGILTGGKSIGESFADAVKNAAANAMQKSLDSLFEQIGGALAAALLGGGGKSGGIAAVASSAATTFAAPVGAVTRSALPAVGGSGASLAWNFWKSKGLADHQVAGVLGNIKAESAFNPAAIGDGGAARGLFQWNDRSPAMLAAVGKDWRNNPLAQHEFAYSELMGPESQAWRALTSAKNAREATAAFAGFERPSGFSWKNPEGAHNFAGRLDGAEEALAKFGGTTAEATNGLGVLGSTLQSIPQALMANGGGGGILSSLTKYGMGLFSGSGQFASAWMKGGLGLYDKGGFTGTGGKYTPAGIVHKGEYVFDAAAVSRIGVPTLERLRGYANGGLVGAPRAPRLNGRGMAANNNAQPGILQVQISGASGDEHIRTLVKQGVGEGLSQYNENQRRGGFGTMQSRYTSQKG